MSLSCFAKRAVHFLKLQAKIRASKNVLKNNGYCECCEKKVEFVAIKEWFRDYYLCSNCGSIPRERALAYVLKKAIPNYADLSIHESSPCRRGASLLLRKCRNYSSSQYIEGVTSGESRNGVLCQDLHNMSFPDNVFDIFVTQDVLEHLCFPDVALKEILRVLRPGGFHLFTVPIVNKFKATERRITFDENGALIHEKPAEYHGNPMSRQGALVTFDWGYDIVSFISKNTGMETITFNIENPERGILAEFIDVFVSRKPSEPFRRR